jgi:hypothetical protein
MNYSKLLVTLAVASALGTSVALADDTDVAGKHGGQRLHCHSLGLGHTGMDARYKYRARTQRLKFEARFHAEEGGRYHAGDILSVYVAGIDVGTMTLEQRGNGNLWGLFEYSYHPDWLADDRLDDDSGRDRDRDRDHDRDDDSDGDDDRDDNSSGLALGGASMAESDDLEPEEVMDIADSDAPLRRFRLRRGASVVVDTLGCALQR